MPREARDSARIYRVLPIQEEERPIYPRDRERGRITKHEPITPHILLLRRPRHLPNPPAQTRPQSKPLPKGNTSAYPAPQQWCLGGSPGLSWGIIGYTIRKDYPNIPIHQLQRGTPYCAAPSPTRPSTAANFCQKPFQIPALQTQVSKKKTKTRENRFHHTKLTLFCMAKITKLTFHRVPTTEIFLFSLALAQTTVNRFFFSAFFLFFLFFRLPLALVL